MKRLGMPVSDTTILAGLRKYAGARSETGSLASSVRVAGVDDWAWRKGHKYGTIIVDLERRAVVDVLADRSAATMADWFKDHPNVDVVSRDRAGLYAEAAREERTAGQAGRRPVSSDAKLPRKRSSASLAAMRHRSGILGSAAAAIRRCRRFPHARIVVLMRSLGHA